MRQHALLLAAVTFGIGCSAAHPSDEVRTGIYQLEIESEIDGCSPARTAGDLGVVGVLVREGAVDAPVPAVGEGLLTAPRVQLRPGASYHAETNRRVSGCDGAWVHEEWTLMASSGEAFEVLHSQSWAGLESCLVRPDTADMPQVDCDSERRLTYRLQDICEAPCALHLDLTGSIVCAC